MKTPANYSHGPHTDADYGVVEPHVNAFEWHNHNGTMMIVPIRKADRFPALKSQAEIDAEEFEFSPLAYVVMFSAAASVALIISAFEWLVGAW